MAGFVGRPGAAMGLRTLSGGWRIVRVMGSKISRLSPHQGICAGPDDRPSLPAASASFHVLRLAG